MQHKIKIKLVRKITQIDFVLPGASFHKFRTGSKSRNRTRDDSESFRRTFFNNHSSNNDPGKPISTPFCLLGFIHTNHRECECDISVGCLSSLDVTSSIEKNSTRMSVMLISPLLLVNVNEALVSISTERK